MAQVPLSAFGDLSLGYTESQGHPELRAAIASSYDRVEPDDLLILGSPVEGIFLAARACLDHGDEVVVLSPAYDALINVFEHVVGPENVRKWDFLPEGDRWSLDIEQLTGLVNSNTKMLVVNFPHNPTGYLPTQEKFDQIIRIVEQNELVLFCDEMYFGLVNSGTIAIPSAVELTDKAVVLSGLSKTYGLPGLRTGWLVVRDQEILENLINWKFYTSICPPAPSEFLALAAWKARDQLRDRNIAQIEQNLDLADAFFSRWPKLFGWRRPLAGSTALVGMNVASTTVFAERMADEAGVLIQPGTTLGASDQQFRMGFGRAGFSQALDQFEMYLKEHSK